MKIIELCRRNAITVRRREGLLDAARLMREHHIGYLVVVEPDFTEATARPIGVLTDRDIVVAAVSRGLDPATLTVGDVMTPNPVTVPGTDSIAVALQELRRVGVRRLPVVGSVGELIGVLSLDDVLALLASEIHDITGALRNEQRFERELRV